MTVYTGDLAGGSLAFVNHYALITGTRSSPLRDIIYMNTGLKSSGGGTVAPDRASAWISNHEWTHLFTLNIFGAPDGKPFCPLDGDLGDTFADSKLVELSHADKLPSKDNGFGYVPLAGKRCGISRGRHKESYTPHTTTTTHCLTMHDINTLDQSASDTQTGLNQYTGGNTPDWQQPLP